MTQRVFIAVFNRSLSKNKINEFKILKGCILPLLLSESGCVICVEKNIVITMRAQSDNTIRVSAVISTMQNIFFDKLRILLKIGTIKIFKFGSKIRLQLF